MKYESWTHDEMVLALNLYLKTPFGKMHRGNPEVVRLAQLLGRTPSSVALRLVNFAACDPQLRSRGVAGMGHGGKKCVAYWAEYAEDREKLLFESERILANYEHKTLEDKYADVLKGIPASTVGRERERMVRTRVNQSVFRQIVLANYDGKCALTGIDIPELLIASHIVPWAENKDERLNPSNGICLSALYDKAFDKGLLSFASDGRTIFSPRLAANIGKDYYERYFLPIQDRPLAVARKYPVDPSFLEWHREQVMLK